MISSFRLIPLSLSLLIGVAAIPAANAQASISNAGSESIEDRVITLERISNAQSQLLQQLQQQLNENQSDIDSLRGQIQQNTYQLNQVVERQKQIYQQIDSLTSSNSSTTGARPESASSPTAMNSSQQQPTTSDNAAMGVQSGDANQEYNAAVDLILKQKQFDQAINALQVWIKKYPDSTYQPNANYWLGQLYYNKAQRDDAAYFFATVVKQYPKSPKAAEALLKIGVIMQDRKDLAKAKTVYAQVIKLYPNTPSAKTAQASLNQFK